MSTRDPLEPPRTPQSTGFRRLFVLLAACVLLLVAAVVTRDRFRPVPPAPPEDPLVGVDDPITRSLRMTDVDSTAIKQRWVEEIPNLDVSMLDPTQLETFVRFANAEQCTCGCGFTLAACRAYDATCDASGPRVEALRDSVAKGLVKLRKGLRERPSATR
ncbi:MAG: hypothetical protein HZA61_08360 [Candidatus Eisenbacteria bacterium]|uniref:Uncharacterized protein n=1 Tax=Eiseniibacteriota bacterium TaxID=2212470 RepID=A0A933SD37_UNCEI|nr:hypothetical protein [Candidatus Eisenbacteria bacterium]